MANNGGNRTSRGVPIVPNIPRRPPREIDFGFGSIVNKKLASKTKKRQEQRESVGSLTLLQSITFAVVWLWTTIIGVLKVRIQGGVSTKKTLVDEKVKTSSRKSTKTRQKR